MRRTLFFAASLVLALPAAADPTGTFDVRGRNPDNGGTYTGTVTVKRKGETYEVKWVIGKDTFRGVGIGALVKDGRFLAGPAQKEDTSIAIGYVSGNSFGMAQYFLQEDGSWKGAWTYGGSNKVAIEEWLPR